MKKLPTPEERAEGLKNCTELIRNNNELIQQENLKERLQREVRGKCVLHESQTTKSGTEYVLDPGFLDTLISHTLSEFIKEAVRVIEGNKFKEYDFEHTFPCEIGVDMGYGYEKRIEKGQKQIMTYKLSEEENLYNKALSTAITAVEGLGKKDDTLNPYDVKVEPVTAVEVLQDNK